MEAKINRQEKKKRLSLAKNNRLNFKKVLMRKISGENKGESKEVEVEAKKK